MNESLEPSVLSSSLPGGRPIIPEQDFARENNPRSADNPPIAENALLVDGHVHIHDCFDLDDFLDAAAANFRRAAPSLRISEETPGCLMLAEVKNAERFGELCERSSNNVGRWQFKRTDEDCSLFAQNHLESRLYLIAGRQVTTAEGVEVLVFASKEPVPDGLALDEVVQRAVESGAIVVLPWGFGKWWFRRGAIVARIMKSPMASTLFLGDNCGRPQLSHAPRLFRLAANRKVRTLPGTDPLPFPSESTTVGRYGFVLTGQFRSNEPAASLNRLLRQRSEQPTIFGRRFGWIASARRQLCVRLLSK